MMDYNKANKKSDDKEQYNFSLSTKIPIFFSVIVFLIYYISLQYSITAGESVELIISACNLKDSFSISNSPSIMLCKLIIFFMPGSSPAYKANFLIAFSNSVAALFSQLTVLRLTECYGSSLMAVSMLYMSKTHWLLSNNFQISIVSNLFTSSLVLMTVIFEQSFHRTTFKNIRRLCWSIFFIGFLSLYHDFSIFIYFVSIVLWVIMKSLKSGIMSSVLAKYLLTSFLFSSLPFFILYLSISSFYSISDFETPKMQFNTNVSLLNITKDYMYHMQSEMCELSPWLFLIGVVTSISWLFISRNICLLVFIIMLIIKFILSSLTTDLTKFMDNKETIDQFVVQCDSVIVIVACVGFHTTIRMVTEKFLGIARLPMTSIFTTMGAIILFALQLRNYEACSKAGNLVVHDYGLAALTSMPKQSIVLTNGLLSSTSMRYLQVCEDIRMDLKIIDLNVIQNSQKLKHIKEKYLDVVFPNEVYNGQSNSTNSFNLRKFIGANIKKFSILLCSGQKITDESPQSIYRMIPFGVCRKFESKRKKIDIDLLPDSSKGLVDHWKHAYEAFASNTWESIANNEMWHAKIALPYFLYREAETADMEYKNYLLTLSYEIYMRSIKLNQQPSKLSHVEFIPSFWHKNFALVCERLLHVEHNQDKVKLFKLSIFHFQQYIHLNPSDADAGRIQEAINILKQKLSLHQNLHKVDKRFEDSIKRTEKLEEMVDQFKNLTNKR